MAEKPIKPDEVQIEASFVRGIVRDTQRAQIPEGGVYDSVDFMLEQPGRVYKRGGWVTHSAELPDPASMVGTIHIPTRVVAICNDDLYDVTSEISPEANLVGTVGYAPRENPTYHINKLILCHPEGIEPPSRVYTVGAAGVVTLGALEGTPPRARHSCVYAGRIVLARGWGEQTPVLDQQPPYKNRLWFSEYPDQSATWDTVNKWVDVSHEVTGLAPIQGTLLVFSPHFCERILGGVPPAVTNPDGTSATDMELQPVGGVGCLDARSIATIDNQVIFASEEGVFATNGVGFTNLMEAEEQSGLLSYWRNLFIDDEVLELVGGMLNRNYYFLSACSTFGVRTNFICYLPTKTWWRTANTNATSFAAGATEQENAELYAALRDEAYIARFSPLLKPTHANKLDGNGNPVEPVLDTRMFGKGPGLKAFGFGRLTYDLRSPEDVPAYLTISQATGIEGDTYQDVVESPLPATTHAERKRFRLFRDSQSLYLKIDQDGPSDTTEIFLVEVEHRSYSLPAEGESTASVEY